MYNGKNNFIQKKQNKRLLINTFTDTFRNDKDEQNFLHEFKLGVVNYVSLKKNSMSRSINPNHSKYLKWTCPSVNTDESIYHFKGKFD
jgi:hypothetical protein